MQPSPSSPRPAATVPATAPSWPGLGLWNLYFLIKLLLYWHGDLNFDLYYNLLFVAFLLVPLRPRALRVLRQVLAIPLGVALLYRDSWYPPFSRLLAQPDVLQFSPAYLLDLLQRFINWELVGAGFIVVVAYLFLAQWLRFTTVVLVALIGLGLNQWVTLPTWVRAPVLAAAQQAQGLAPAMPAAAQPEPGRAAAAPPAPAGKPDNATLNQALDHFHQEELGRRVAFPDAAQEPPFDVLLISICSLSWADLDEVGLSKHPLFQHMNVIFDDFNSATSYSGPAVLRLLRATCGQPSHSALYQPADASCYLMQNLQRMGYETEAALNHNGSFQGFLNEIKTEGHIPDPYLPKNLRPRLTAFDSSPIWDDLTTLSQWWDKRTASKAPRTALLYNTITLHDGNREATADGGGRIAPFNTRAQTLLDQLDAFIDKLAKSGRRVAVVLVPEHGAALKADKMQIAGMREVPTRNITHVPVAVRLLGTKDSTPVEPVHVAGPSSFLGLAELLNRLLRQPVFNEEKIDWSALTANLPTTEPVSENEGTVLMNYGNETYIRMGGSNWIAYPR